MDINRLSYFISVAKHLNFTKAANECYIAQTAMSRHILALEEELGVTLFYRNNRNVVLTPAGRVFLEEAMTVLEQWKNVVHRTQITADGYEGSISIGFGPYEKNLVIDHIKFFLQSNPKIEVVVKQYSFQKMVGLLNSSVLDLVYSTDEIARVISDAVCRPLAISTEVRLVMDWSHPFAQKEFSINELNDLEFVYNSELGGPTPASHFLRVCSNYGFTPKHLLAVNTLDAKLAMIQTSNKVCLIPSYKADVLEDDLCIRTLPAPINPPMPCYVSALQSNINPAVWQYFNSL